MFAVSGVATTGAKAWEVTSQTAAMLIKVVPTVLLIIALVLAHLPAAHSAEVLSGFAPEQHAEVAHRIATMDRTSPEMVRLVEEELGRRMGSLLAHQDMTTVGGVDREGRPVGHARRRRLGRERGRGDPQRQGAGLVGVDDR